jgi:hypothetical protein
MNALACAPAFTLLFITAPSKLMSFSEKILAQPVRPAGMMLSNRGAVRGKVFDSTPATWHPAPVKLKLNVFDE